MSEHTERESFLRAESRWLGPPYLDEEYCPKCLNWGVIMGTNTDDHWGDACPCGTEFHCPKTPPGLEQLLEDHAIARTRAVLRAHMRAFDLILDALRKK